MDLIIPQHLAQRILEHLVRQPTGSAAFADVNAMVQQLQQLKPAAPPVAQPKEPVA